ncbi:MAG: glycosyltransferase family 4 protein [Luteitalea sp.]
MSAVRVAWFSPFPPVHSGIAAYSLDVLEGVRYHHRVDLFADDPVWHAAGGRLHAGQGETIAPMDGPLGLPLYRAFDFTVLHDRTPYDLIVYQLGNAACHRFLWPYLLRWPGLIVLHDAALHHARAQALLGDRRADAYRAEFRFNHPGVDPRVADFVVAGLEGSPYYLWPMLRLVMRRARAVVVHGSPLQEALADEFPDTPLTTVSMGVPDPWDAVHAGMARADTAGSASRPSHLPSPDQVVLAAFGVITPEKRILPLLRAVAALRTEAPHVRVRLVGEIGEHYALWQDVAATGTRDLIEVTGYVDDEQLAAELRAADVCVCLRWPTARETSASWLRCLAAGKPTVVPDQLSTVDVPTLDPRHWQLKHDRTDAVAVFQPPDPSRAVAVSIELSDEEAMLRQALRRLVVDADLRRQLGRRAREWWAGRHTLARMHRDYEAALAWAVTQPVPEWPADAPAHLRPDPSAWARSLTAAFGVEVDILGSREPGTGNRQPGRGHPEPAEQR